MKAFVFTSTDHFMCCFFDYASFVWSALLARVFQMSPFVEQSSGKITFFLLLVSHSFLLQPISNLPFLIIFSSFSCLSVSCVQYLFSFVCFASIFYADFLNFHTSYVVQFGGNMFDRRSGG